MVNFNIKKVTENWDTPTKPQNHSKSKQWPQYLAVLTASLSSWACGLHFAWPSPSFPIILDDEFPGNITSIDTSYIAIMQPLGDIIGAPIAAIFADIIGRKLGIIAISIPLFIAWIIIAFANNVYTFCVGRFLSGIGDGFLFIVFPMYVGEVTEPKVRGVLGCTLSLAMLVGMLMINLIAPYLSIQNTALLCSASPILTVLLFMWMPESPYYLIMKNKLEDARKSLYFLRRCDVSTELSILEKDVQRQMSERGTYKDLMYIKSNRKALFIMICVRTMQQVSGTAALGIFTQTIFLKSNTNMSHVLSSGFYLLTQMIITLIGACLVDKYGRKPLIILSSFLCGIILSIGGIYFYFDEKTDYDLSSLDWMPVFVMIMYVVVFGFGLGTAPTLMLGELFSASIKGKALCVMCIYYAACIAVVLKLFHFLSEFGMCWPFLLFGTCCFLNIVFAFLFVPETKGKTLEEIQQYLKGNKKSKDANI